MISTLFCCRINEKDDKIPYQVTISIPSHIEADQYVPGNILYSDMSAFYTTNENETTVIVGQTERSVLPYTEGIGTEATFSYITSFAQVNVTHVLLADFKRGCIRMLDPTTNRTEQVLGICRERPLGYFQVDGKLMESRFGPITGFTYHHGQESIYIFE